jgi:hypothetical protein
MCIARILASDGRARPIGRGHDRMSVTDHCLLWLSSTLNKNAYGQDAGKSQDAAELLAALDAEAEEDNEEG